MSEIAVVIPCYNLGRTVEQALDSVVTQTRGAAEIVVVDDGSTDLYTRQLLASLRRPRTRVMRTENHGLPAARNYGIRHTTAPYIVTLDADDYLDPTYLEKTAARLDAEPEVGFVSTAIHGFEGADYVWTPPPCDLVSAFTQGSAHASAMFRRKLWAVVGGYDEAFVGGCEDLDFWISAMELGFQGETIDEPLLHRRVRADSLHHGSVEQGGYRAIREYLLRKHRRTIEEIGPALVFAQESFITVSWNWVKDLEAQQDRLKRELAQAEEQIVRLTQLPAQPSKHGIQWGDLRRLKPISSECGLDRGTPVDRYYIQEFLKRYSSDIRGRVLDVGGFGYAKRFGDSRITRADVLTLDATNFRGEIIVDLYNRDIAHQSYDCVIAVEIFHLIYDINAALSECSRILKPGGVLLATFSCVTQVDARAGTDRDFWRFTESTVREMLSRFFRGDKFETHQYGNIKAATASLYGIASEELRAEERDTADPLFPVVIGVRAAAPEKFYDR